MMRRALWHWLTCGEPAWQPPHRWSPLPPSLPSPWSRIGQFGQFGSGARHLLMDGARLLSVGVVIRPSVIWEEEQWCPWSNPCFDLWSRAWTTTSSPLVMFSLCVSLLSMEAVSFGQIGEKVSEKMFPADSNRPTTILLPTVIDRRGIGECMFRRLTKEFRFYPHSGPKLIHWNFKFNLSLEASGLSNNILQFVLSCET